jgi:hypothetical protein
MLGFKRAEFKITEVMPEGYTFEEAIAASSDARADGVVIDDKRSFVVTRGGEFVTKFAFPPSEENE